MKRPSPHRQGRRCLATLISSTAAVTLLASGAGAAPKEEDLGVAAVFSVVEGYTDNVRADRLRRSSAWYTQLEAETEWTRGGGWLPHRVGGYVRSRFYSVYDQRDYTEFGPTFSYDWARVSATVAYVYSPHRLRVDPEAEEPAFADGHDLYGELRTKFGKNKRWTALAGFRFEADFYDPGFQQRSFYEETVDAGLRYRATDWLAPRARFTYSWRDAISSNFDREEAKLQTGFDMYLPAGVRATFRYEKTWRNFLVGYERDSDGGRNSNFGREDDADEFEGGLDAPVPWIASTSVRIEYRHYFNGSTRLQRSYEVNEASLRLSYAF